jgi:hypothetical protein
MARRQAYTKNHACRICVLFKGITIRDTFETEDELFDHLEREHHYVVPREGETQADADRRVLDNGIACDDCKAAITERLKT